MQPAFDFLGTDDLTIWRDRLLAHFGPQQIFRRDPVGQLVKSSISSRTRDPVSLAAYDRLVAAYPRWDLLAAADPKHVERIIFDVTFPEDKAARLIPALQEIARHDPSFRLAFLRDGPVEDALRWLERLPNVARKVSASTLNFSTLARPAFVVDAHMRRIFARLGFVRNGASTENVYHAVMSSASRWTADQLAEFHMLLKLLGQTLCPHDAADCRSCPLAATCPTANG